MSGKRGGRTAGDAGGGRTAGNRGTMGTKRGKGGQGVAECGEREKERRDRRLGRGGVYIPHHRYT